MILHVAVLAATLAAADKSKGAKAPPAPPPAAAPAAGAPTARQVFENAQKLYKAGKFAEALAGFEEAYKLKPHPIIFFNYGRCNEHLNQPSKALKSYRTYLLQLPDAVDREAVQKSMAGLERQLQKNHVQQLMVTADPVDSRISVDGTALGASPAFIDLGPGDHRIVIEREGLETVSRSFVMSTTKSMDVNFVLQPPAPKPPPTGVLPPPPPMPNTAPLVAANVAPTTPTVSTRSEHPLRGKSWIPLIGVAAGGALAGIGFSQVGSISNALDTELRTKFMVTDQARSLANQGRLMQTLAWVGVGVGSASLATAVFFFLFPSKGDVVASATLLPGGVSGSIGGTFP